VSGGGELDEMDEMFMQLAAVLNDPAADRRYRYLYKGRWRYALPFPWHTRLRLWCTGKVDGVAIWLAYHERPGTAEALWRLARLWRAK
jgi:hypothetical protein